MLAHRIANGLYSIAVGSVNVFFVDAKDGCALIDTGFPNSADRIFFALEELGRGPNDIRYIVLTHGHPDHTGSAAALKRATGAKVYAHPLDAPMIEQGSGFRPLTPAPGLLNRILFPILIAPKMKSVDPVGIDHHIEDGQVLPIAGGMTAVHAPGHCAGQIALLWPENGGVLFAADAGANVLGLGWSIAYEDFHEGRRSLAKLAELDFQIACFGHGRSLARDGKRFFKKFRRL